MNKTKTKQPAFCKMNWTLHELYNFFQIIKKLNNNSTTLSINELEYFWFTYIANLNNRIPTLICNII